MAEGDRVVAEAIIRSVFDSQGPDRERFASTFAAIQSREAPLTRFGAARRWRMVAEIHDSLESSLARLTLVYDDWWRRWRVEEYDPILAIPTFFEKSNPIRYAAVIYAMQNIADLFPLRNSLIAATNGTQMALGAAAYRLRLGTYARETLQTYSQYTRKRSDRDPWDKVFGKFQYFIADGTEAMDTPYGRVTLPAGVAVLYSVGLDHEDGRARLHSDDAKLGDMVIWPPVKPLQRAAGLRD